MAEPTFEPGGLILHTCLAPALHTRPQMAFAAVRSRSPDREGVSAASPESPFVQGKRWGDASIPTSQLLSEATPSVHCGHQDAEVAPRNSEITKEWKLTLKCLLNESLQ